METVARVKENIQAVVEATRNANAERELALQKDVARERKAREEAEAVLADTTRAYSALREHQALLQSEQGELQATISQMRDEIKAKDAELSKLKPDHRPSFWSEPKQVSDSGRPTYDGLKQKLQEKDAQLDEALAIIKELTAALQGKPMPGKAEGTSAGCPACGFGAAPDGEPAAEEAGDVDAVAGDADSEAEEEPAPAPPAGLAPAPPMFWVDAPRQGAGQASFLPAGAGLLGKLLGAGGK